MGKDLDCVYCITQKERYLGNTKATTEISGSCKRRGRRKSWSATSKQRTVWLVGLLIGWFWFFFCPVCLLLCITICVKQWLYHHCLFISDAISLRIPEYFSSKPELNSCTSSRVRSRDSLSNFKSVE